MLRILNSYQDKSLVIILEIQKSHFSVSPQRIMSIHPEKELNTGIKYCINKCLTAKLFNFHSVLIRLSEMHREVFKYIVMYSKYKLSTLEYVRHFAHYTYHLSLNCIILYQGSSKRTDLYLALRFKGDLNHEYRRVVQNLL